MNKYEKFTIYKIYENSKPEMHYIGSTVSYNRRKIQHKKNTRNRSSKSYKYPLYQYIRSVGGWDYFTIEIYCLYPCANKIEGLKKEREIIELLNSPLNAIKPIS
jgi:hypothetical protein